MELLFLTKPRHIQCLGLSARRKWCQWLPERAWIMFTISQENFCIFQLPQKTIVL